MTGTTTHVLGLAALEQEQDLAHPHGEAPHGQAHHAGGPGVAGRIERPAHHLALSPRHGLCGIFIINCIVGRIERDSNADEIYTYRQYNPSQRRTLETNIAVVTARALGRRRAPLPHELLWVDAMVGACG